MVYKIPSGVTGFVEVHKIDKRQFKTICYLLQILGLIKVIEVSGFPYPDNFYKAEVKDEEGKLYIYVNYATLVFGFSRIGNIHKIQGSFIDKPLLKEALEKLDNQYSVIPASILNLEASKDNFVLLDEFEHKQVLYWYPHTIGEIIFSTCFD